MKALLAVVAGAVLLTGVLAAGASAGMECMGMKKMAAQAEVKGSVKAGNTVCPVSGEKIDAAKMQPVEYEYNGTAYNFCCGGCIGKFKQDPEMYINKLQQQQGEKS